MHTEFQQKKIFIASCLALAVTGIAFAIRVEIVTIWGAAYQLSVQQLGFITATAFWGFTLAQFIEGPLIDLLGMDRIVKFAFLTHISGIIITIFSGSFWPLYIGTLLIGLGNGSIEASCNPLTAALYPKNKSKMLNRFHSWYSGGIVIGGLAAYFLIEKLHLSWPILMTMLILPTVIYGYLFFTLKLPETERVASGVSYKAMLRACVNPLFIFMALCMILTAATEVGSQQWFNLLLGDLSVSAILLLVLINFVIAMGRSFAGPLIQWLSSPGVLLLSAIISFTGLRWLSITNGYTSYAAAFVFAVGVCFFWPTMLGFVNEYIPESGALGLNIMGGIGQLSVAAILPIVGHWYDVYKANEMMLNAAEVSDTTIQLMAGQDTLQTISYLPLILIVAFTFLFIRYRNGPEKILRKMP